MGTGGATALRSPEGRIHRNESGPLVTKIRLPGSLHVTVCLKNGWFPDICIHVFKLQLRTEFFQIARSFFLANVREEKIKPNGILVPLG
jgi:hypothetical protein